MHELSIAQNIMRIVEEEARKNKEPTEINKAIDPQLIIEKRNHVGGSSIGSMNKSLINAQNAIKNINQWIQGKLSISTTSKKNTDLIVNNLIQKYGS